MIKTGQLPITGVIDFIFSADALKLIANKLSKELEIKATLSFPDRESELSKIIRVKINTVRLPGSYTKTTHGRLVSNFMDVRKEIAVDRAENYLFDKILPSMAWIIFGEIVGEKKIPICILWIEKYSLGIFSLKKDNENLAEFKPALN